MNKQKKQWLTVRTIESSCSDTKVDAKKKKKKNEKQLKAEKERRKEAKN